MSRKLFVALENEEGLAVGPEMPVEQTLMEQDAAVNEIQDNIEAQASAIEASEVLEKMDAAETDAERIEIAQEHILSMIGYKKNYAQESFSKDLETTLGVAQEGFFGRIGNAVRRAFTSDVSFKKRLDVALQNLQSMGSKQGILKDPNWSKNLIAKGSDLIDASDVAKFLDKVDSALDIKEINKYLEKAADIYDRISYELRESNFVSDPKTEKAIDDLFNEVKKDISDMQSVTLKYVQTGEMDMYPDYEPIQYKDAIKMKDRILKGWTASDTNNPSFQRYDKACTELNNVLIQRRLNSIKFHFTGIDPKDVGKSVGVANRINESIFEILKAMQFRYKVAYSILRYIESSVAK